MELLLIRHGLPERVEVEPGSIADPGLTDVGRAQAAALAAELASGPRVDALYSSPLRRARETAAPVADALGLDVVVDPELAEFDRLSHFYVPIEELRELKDSRWDDLVAGRLGAEGEVDPLTFQRVVVGAVERVVEANPERVVAVVAHGGVINAYLAHIIGARSILFFEPAYTSISRVLAARTGERMLRTINEHHHIRHLL